jgi:hypothetical protein
MTTKCFIAVVNTGDYRKETHMRRFQEESILLNNIVNLEAKHTLERVFTVDEFGKVVFYEVVFDRRLKLKEKEGK